MTELSRRSLVRALAIGVPAAVAIAEFSSADPGKAPLRVRGVVRRFDAVHTRDGAGVKLSRAIGSRELSMIDPFVLLDEIHSDKLADYVKGFPTHPHRGFETVTYMVEGAMEHHDSLGNGGRLGPGSTQWMTAGHGIVHSEMPKQVGGMMWGFQLWVNLPAAHKMIRPRYQNLDADRIVEIAESAAHVRLVAGELDGKRGPVSGIVTQPHMMDVKLARGGSFARVLPPTHNAFVYVFDGAAEVGAARTRVARGQIAVLGPGDAVAARSGGGARFLLCAAQPIGEPVARSGPFVMNTQEELRQAWDDYRAGRLVLTS